MASAAALEVRLNTLLRAGFSAEAAEKVFVAVALPLPTAIDAKLAGLRARHFADPVKLVTSSPPILGYSFDNIDAKLRYGRRLAADVVPMIAANPALLGYAMRRLRFCVRLAYEAGRHSIAGYSSRDPYRAFLENPSWKALLALKRYRPELAARFDAEATDEAA